MLKLKKITPAELTPTVLDEIVKLIQTQFVIDNAVAEEVVKDKHIIHLYTDTKRNKLIGVIGFRCDLYRESVYLYVGASVLDNDYQKCGILSKSIRSEVFKVVFKYPSKNKYACAFCTTPEAFQYFYFLDQFWPSRDGTPDEMVRVQEDYMVLIGVTDYSIESGALINHTLKGKIKEINPSYKIKRNIKEYFNEIIGQESEGDQVFCITRVNFSSFKSLMGRCIAKYVKRVSKHLHVGKLFFGRK